ncbi:MAG: hypothetical protein RLZZ383_1902, partial [Pseudomonadota bacterium]
SAAAIGVAQGAGTAQALGGSLDLTLDGSSLKVDAATVITPDIIASNGIIHEIDAVLVPNLVDVVTTDADLSTLTSAVLAADGAGAGLVSTLSGAGPFTIFAPVNAGFGELLAANDLADLNALVGAVGVETVTNVLVYHVASGAVPSSAVVGLSSATTLGGTVTIDVAGGNVILNQGIAGLPGTNDATVTTVDILTSNGIIHKLDKVITPAN